MVQLSAASSAAMIAGCLAIAAAWARAAAPLATMVVEAGKHDRLDTPVRAPLPTGLDPNKPMKLLEVTGGKSGEVPCQLDRGRPAQLCWILAGKTPAGGSRTFRLVPGELAEAAAVEVRKTDEHVEILVAGRKVLRYYHAPLAPPKGVSKRFARSAFIHPAWSPSGEVLTDNFPRDHYHHKGVWNPWTRARFRGRDVDFWNLGKGQATVRFARYLSLDSGPVFAGFRARHEHVVFDKPRGETIALNETWCVRAWRVGGPKAGYWLWDVTSTQRCGTDSPLELPKYHYGGFSLRGSRKWRGSRAYILTSAGRTRKDGHGSRARWCALGGEADGKAAGAILMGHPDNFRFPEPMRIWPPGSRNVFANFAPSILGDWKIAPGKDHVLRYRICAYDGKVNAAEAERLWRDFGRPPKVTVRPG